MSHWLYYAAFRMVSFHSARSMHRKTHLSYHTHNRDFRQFNSVIIRAFPFDAFDGCYIDHLVLALSVDPAN